MQKKYKHKITGIVGTTNSSDNFLHFERSCGKNIRENSEVLVLESIHMSLVENSNDWEEIKEKEFEILEFKVSYDNRIIKLNSDGSYSSEGGIPASLDRELQWVKDGIRIISKVKRLSDGEIFSIGDKVYYTKFPDNAAIKIGTPFAIDNFYIRNDGVLLVRSKDNIVVETISTIKHSAKPLFLDELENEVFEGDKVFSVCYKYNWEIEDNRSVNKASKFVQDNYKEQAAWKYFKYKEDRDNYVTENKPTFSRTQINKALKDSNLIGYSSPCFSWNIKDFYKSLGIDNEYTRTM